MKVLIISREIPPHGGGAGVVALNYCKALSVGGAEVTLIATEPQKGLFDSLDNFKLISIPTKRGMWIFSMIKELVKLSVSGFDKIIINDVAATYVTGILFNSLDFKKSLVVLHGSEPENIYNNPSFLHKLILYPYFYKRSIKLSNKIIAVSHYMKAKFLEETPFTNSERIVVIHSGFELPSPTLDLVKKNSTRKILLTVSRIEEGKGFREMLETLEPILRADLNLMWVIIGKGAFYDDFSNMVANSSVKAQIILKGYVEYSELNIHYQEADLFILLSNYKESLGLVYIEAQAFGCPVIGYNSYGVKETVLNGKTGFLVNSPKDIINIIEEKKYLGLVKNDIISNAQQFSLSHMYKKLIQVFENEK